MAVFPAMYPLFPWQVSQLSSEYPTRARWHCLRYLFRNLDAWIRSRLRSTQLKKWKKPRKFQRIMIKVGFDPRKAHRTWVRMNKWQSVTRRKDRFVMNNLWFSKLGLISLHNFTLETLKSSWLLIEERLTWPE